MLFPRISTLLAAAAMVGFCAAAQVAVYPLPVWPGTNPAGVGNTYFHDFSVPVAVPDAEAAPSIHHGYSAAAHGAVSKNAEEGDGHQHHAQHFANQGEHDQKGYLVDHHHDILSDGHHDKFLDAGHQGDSGAEVKKFHDEGSHHKDQHESAKSVKAAKFGEKKGHKRGHKTKGYHNKFHKDEYHKEHRFYDDLDKSGHHGKYGKYHAHHGKNEHARKKGGTHKSGHDEKKFGKQGFSDKGRFEDEHQGHTSKGGHESYHKHHNDYAKEQGFTGGAAHAYAQAKKH